MLLASDLGLMHEKPNVAERILAHRSKSQGEAVSDLCSSCVESPGRLWAAILIQSIREGTDHEAVATL